MATIPRSVETLLTTLSAEGFTEDAGARADAVERGKPLSHNGEYEVLAALSKGEVTVVIERNTAPEVPGGESVTTHPPVARVFSPRGTAGARVSDPDAVLGAARDLA